MHRGRDAVRLRLELTSPRRAADKLKYLAGSEAAMGAWIGDVPPESCRRAAARGDRDRSGAHPVTAATARASSPTSPAASRSARGRPPAGSTSSASTPTTTTGSCCPSRSSTAPTSRWAPHRRRIRVVSTFDAGAVEVALAELDQLFPAHRGDVPEWAAYPLGVAWALLRASGAAAADRHRRRSRDRLGRAHRRRAVVVGRDRGRRRNRARTTRGGSASTASRSPRSAARPRTRPSGRPRGSWTRWRPCSDEPTPRSSSTAARSMRRSSTSDSRTPVCSWS